MVMKAVFQRAVVIMTISMFCVVHSCIVWLVQTKLVVENITVCNNNLCITEIGGDLFSLSDHAFCVVTMINETQGVLV